MHKIRKALATEAELISELSIRSKAYWGYDDEFMSSCRNELSQSREQIEDEANCYFVAEFKSEVVGFYKLESLNKEAIVLEALFVEPLLIGSGVGRVLFEHAKSVALEKGGRYLTLQSDPYAEPFYRAMGALVVGREESGSIEGRYLPIMQIAL